MSFKASGQQDDLEDSIRTSVVNSVKKTANKVVSGAVINELTSEHRMKCKRGKASYGGHGMFRKLILPQKEFEFNSDIQSIVTKLDDAFTQVIERKDEEKDLSVGLIEDNALGWKNRFKRGYASFLGNESKSGRSVTIPRETIYLSEKSREIYLLYSTFLMTLLYKMGFKSDQLIEDTHDSSNSNKFVFIVCVLQWLAAKTLHQEKEEGLTLLLDFFAGNLLIESNLLAKRGYIRDSKSEMYSEFVSEQPKYIKLIQARRKEEELSKTVIHSINDGLDALDDYEKTLICFLLAKANDSFSQFSIEPKDLDRATYLASFNRFYLEQVEAKGEIGKPDIHKLHQALSRLPEYAGSQETFETFFSLLKDIAALRKLLNALSNLHTTTGWLVIGLSNYVNMEELDKAFAIFHAKFSGLDESFRKAMLGYSQSTQPISIGTELQKVWARRKSEKIKIDFQKISSSDVIEYVRRQISTSVMDLTKAQKLLVERGLAKQSLLLQQPLSAPIITVEMEEKESIHEVEKNTVSEIFISKSFYLSCALLTASILATLILASLILASAATIPGYALLITSISSLVALCLMGLFRPTIRESAIESTMERLIERTESSTASISIPSSIFNPDPQLGYHADTGLEQVAPSLYTPAEKLDQIKTAMLELLNSQAVNFTDRPETIQKIHVDLNLFFYDFRCQQSGLLEDAELWTLIERLRNQCMIHQNNSALYNVGMALSTSITKRESGTLDSLETVFTDTGLHLEQQEQADYTPLVY